MAEKKKVTLRSADGELFEVEKVVALQSQTIKHMIDDNCAEEVIPLPNVHSEILAKVLEFIMKHFVDVSKPEEEEDRVSADELKSWDAEFFKVDQSTLYDLIMAANYLDVKSLLELSCQTAAEWMKGKNPEEIRKQFNIKTKFSAEEEEEIRRENETQWLPFSTKP